MKYFLTVVQEENITKAAELLHITQPTLSRQLMQLEEELGVQLFIRGKRMKLSAAGVKLQHQARELIKLADKIEDTFSRQQEISGKISIGTGSFASYNAFCSVMHMFRRQYPKVSYEIYTSNTTHLKEQLDAGLLDFAILLEPVNVEEYDFIRLPENERWGILMRADALLARKMMVTREDLDGLPLIITSSRAAIQNELSNWLGESLTDYNILAVNNIITGSIPLVEQGRAYAFALEGSVNMLDRNRFAFRPFSPELTQNTVLTWKKFHPFWGAAGVFLEYYKSMHLRHGFEFNMGI